MIRVKDDDDDDDEVEEEEEFEEGYETEEIDIESAASTGGSGLQLSASSHNAWVSGSQSDELATRMNKDREDRQMALASALIAQLEVDFSTLPNREQQISGDDAVRIYQRCVPCETVIGLALK